MFSDLLIHTEHLGSIWFFGGSFSYVVILLFVFRSIFRFLPGRFKFVLVYNLEPHFQIFKNRLKTVSFAPLLNFQNHESHMVMLFISIWINTNKKMAKFWLISINGIRLSRYNQPWFKHVENMSSVKRD